MIEEKYMRRAIELARLGEGYVNPNPLVGAVIVKEGQIIGEGYHEKYGEKHAERNAIESSKEDLEGSTIYVTLEPCCHHGKQPPCVDAIIEAKISKVVIGSNDPNPLVSGKGIEKLRENKIEVVTGFLKEECDEINEVFFHYIRTKTPFVVMKYAMTMDGKIATSSGRARWVSGEESRAHVQILRNKLSGIMLGVQTVIADDPALTCRIKGGVNPTRIICDSNLRIPFESEIVKTAYLVPTIIATCSDDKEKIAYLEEKSCKILKVEKKDDRLDLKDLMKKLGEEGIDSILLEGGGTLNWSALNQRIVNKVCTYIAPKLFGGKDAKTPVEGEGVFSPPDAFMLKNTKIRHFGDDIYLESEVDYSCLQE